MQAIGPVFDAALNRTDRKYWEQWFPADFRKPESFPGPV